MTCKDCVYYEACVNLMTDPKRIESMSYGNSETWLCFKDKSKFIELPRTDENSISRSFINQDIGKTVLLTEEKAEKALEGISHD